MRIAFTLGAAKTVGLAMLITFGALASSTPAMADDAPRTPEEVAEYFATGVIPRLADLYGPGANGESGIDFDDSAAVGTITRVLEWTEQFRDGEPTDRPVQLTNDWVAPITVGEAQQAGLATVWINPHTNSPELATFEPSGGLGLALAEAPAGSQLIRDLEHSAWFALLDDRLTPLVAGDTGITAKSLSLAQAQDALLNAPERPKVAASNRGFVIAGLTLGLVVVILALFVLMPDRKRSKEDPDVELGFPAEPTLIAAQGSTAGRVTPASHQQPTSHHQPTPREQLARRQHKMQLTPTQPAREDIASGFSIVGS